MTREQLEGRRARLLRELADSAGAEPAPTERLVRLARDLAETERLLAARAAEVLRPGNVTPAGRPC